MLTNFPNGVASFGTPMLGGAAGIPLTGTFFFVDPVNGADGNDGSSPDNALKTLYAAHRKMTAGKNDTAILIGNGATTGTARLSLALAQADAIAGGTTVSAGTLVWSKNACHLIGVSAPSANSRARISNTTTETQANFGAAAPLVSVTAQGCLFANISAFEGFATGGADEVCWKDSGGRNSYIGCEIRGGGDTASATTNVATMRSLLISGSTGENRFVGCTIGLDTVARSTGSFEMEISGGSPRNVFENCTIETNAGAVGCTWLKVGATGIDRYVLFRNCTFTNPTLGGVGASSMTTGFSVNTAAGGAILLQNCLTFGAAKIDTGNLNTLVNTANAASLGSAATATSA